MFIVYEIIPKLIQYLYRYDSTSNTSLKNIIKSPACSFRENWHVATVVKVPPGSELEIFSEIFFRDQISREQMGPPSNQSGFGMENEPNRNEQIRRRLQDLTRLTNIKVSLIKGWGQGYRRPVCSKIQCSKFDVLLKYSFKRVTSCPCWIEINLSKPVKELDQVLQQYSVPGGNSTT